MTVRLTGKQFSWTFANTLKAPTTHKSTVIEKELKKFKITTTKCFAKEKVISQSAVNILDYGTCSYSFLDEALDCLLETIETSP